MSSPKEKASVVNVSSGDGLKHTPGPWHRNIPPATHYTTVWSGRNTHVARVLPEGLSEAEVEANICLIASAPELLEALRLLVSWTDALEAKSASHVPSDAFMEPIRAAIQSATRTA